MLQIGLCLHPLTQMSYEDNVGEVVTVSNLIVSNLVVSNIWLITVCTDKHVAVIKSSTYSSWRISLMVLSSEIISLATMLKPNSLIDAWTESLYSGPRTRGLAPSPGPPGTPGGSGSLGSKFPRIPFFSTGLL